MDGINSNDPLSPRSTEEREWTFIDDEPTPDTRLLMTSTSSSSTMLSPSVGDRQYFVPTSDIESNGRCDQANETCNTKAAATQTSDSVVVTSDLTNDIESESDLPPGALRIRLRIGESIRSAHFKTTEVVEDFIAQFFADEIVNGKHVRLIYMGMLLARDRTMGEYEIEEDGVIHAVITTTSPSSRDEGSEVELKGLSDPVNSLLTITGLFLYGLWTLLYHYPHLFSWKAIILLAALSLVHISTTVSRVAA